MKTYTALILIGLLYWNLAQASATEEALATSVEENQITIPTTDGLEIQGAPQLAPTEPPAMPHPILPPTPQPPARSVPDLKPESHLTPPESISAPPAKSEMRKKVRYSRKDYRNPTPELGLSLQFSPGAFGNTVLHPVQNNQTAYAIAVMAEYQPAFLQNIGVIDLGSAFTVYPIIGGSTPTLFSVLGASALMRYQFRYWNNQLLVPIVAYTVEAVRAEFNKTNGTNFIAQGPTFGLWILLDFLDPSAAASASVTNGVARTYLMLEWRNVTGENPNGVAEAPVTPSSPTYTLGARGSGSFYTGLRLEL